MRSSDRNRLQISALPHGQRRAKVTVSPKLFSNEWGLRSFPIIFRTRFLITAAFVCHLLLAPPLVTSQLLAVPSQESAGNQAISVAPESSMPGEEVRIEATTQEKDGPIYKLRGHVEIRYGSYSLYADEVTYNDDTGEATGEGHMVLDGGSADEHIEASHGTYNFRTDRGKFYDV